MKLSTRARYGLRICFLMGLHGEVMPLSALVKQTGLSDKYLEQLLAMLKKAGIVEAKRGTSGGYTLTRVAEEISIDEILTALNDNFDISDCASSVCDDDYCPNKGLFTKLHQIIKNVLVNTSLFDMINDNFCKPRESFGKKTPQKNGVFSSTNREDCDG